MRYPPWVLSSLLLLAVAPPIVLSLPPIYADGMVLQREQDIIIRGSALPLEQVTVSIAGQRRTAFANAQGDWTARLQPLPTGGPYSMTVTSKGESLSRRDILVGDVWLCAGQSNMEWPVKDSNAFRLGGPNRAENLRMFQVPRTVSDTPLPNVVGAWFTAKETAKVQDFSAVAYAFGREVQRSINVPVGLIQTAWAGTPIQAWIRPAALGPYPNDPYAPPLPADQLPPVENRATYPGVLWNGMVAPLTSFPIRGVLWYQGEANIGRANQYRDLFSLMITDWRRQWGQGFPFYFVQLARVGYGGDEIGISPGAALREAQTTGLELANTGMVVTTDIGERSEVWHPGDKETIGNRLALLALAKTYGFSRTYQAPPFVRQTVQGSQIRIRFGGNLRTGDDREPRGFLIAGEDHKWIRAIARIDQDEVVVSGEGLKEPVAVRYNWQDRPDGNLVGDTGLPVAPFRTDTWPLSPLEAG